MLWILCVDDHAFEVLGRLDLPNVRLLKLSDLETPQLLSVKSSRTIAEYCWTLTPFAPRFVFEADQYVERVTYIDADLWFLKNPRKIFKEFDDSGKQVLITDHAYSPEYDQSATSGQYCVQFMSFSRSGGEHVRKWWEDRCIDWCFARFEHGKFGDQKYLDDWPDRFCESVHVLQMSELTLAPWNAARFPYGPAVFFHFHGLRLVSRNKAEIGNYYIPNVLRNNVYRPYLADIAIAIEQLSFLDSMFMSQAPQQSSVRRLFQKLKWLKPIIVPLIADTQLYF